jgi:hypothetical protein
MIRMSIAKWVTAGALALAAVPAIGWAVHSGRVIAAPSSATPMAGETRTPAAMEVVAHKKVTHKKASHKKVTHKKAKHSTRHAAKHKHKHKRHKSKKLAVKTQ